MKKIFLTIGSFISIAAPIITVVACGDDSSGPAKVERQEITFSASSVNLLPADGSRNGDVDITNLSSVVKSFTNSSLNNNIMNLKDKNDITLIINFQDSTFKEEIKISGKSVTIEKVLVEAKGGDFTLDESKPKIQDLKIYTENLIKSFVAVSKIQGVTTANVKDKVSEQFGVAVGANAMFFAGGEDATVPWDGTWVTNVPYDRTAIVLPKGSIALKYALDNNATPINITNSTGFLDEIESGLRTYAISSNLPPEFNSFKTEENRLQSLSPPQSQITVATFTTKGASADDMIVVEINGLSKQEVFEFVRTFSKNGVATYNTMSDQAKYIYNQISSMI